MPALVKELNWIDIVAAILLLRICYIAIKSGVIAEFFKLLGTCSAVYLSLHYYTRFAHRVGTLSLFKNLNFEFLSFLCCLFLLATGYFAFKFLYLAFVRLVKAEPAPALDKWGAFLFGILRWLLAVSMMLYVFMLAPLRYAQASVRKSYAAGQLFNFAPAAYTGVWQAVVSKFLPGDTYNDDVASIQKKIK